MIRLNSNENYENINGTCLKDILLNCNIELNRYPDSDSLDLRETYAKFLNLKKENILAGNGSDEMIGLIVSTVINKGKKVVTVDPDFSMYDFYVNDREGTLIKYKSCEDGGFNINDFIEKVKDINPSLILLSNPNNPTGYSLSVENMKLLLNTFKDTNILIDEAYFEFSGITMVPFINEYNNLLVTRTLSKAWGLAALRLGFLIGNEFLINKLSQNKVPYNVNLITQLIAINAINNPQNMEKSVELTVKERERLFEKLSNIQIENKDKIKFYKSNANFIFGKSEYLDNIKEFLNKENILIRYFKNNTFRVTVGSSEENDIFIAYIKKALERIEL